MNFLKRIAFAFKGIYTSIAVRLVANLVAIFYFLVANDLFWHSNADWQGASKTIVFFVPLAAFVAVAVVFFVYYFMQKKVEQVRAEEQLRCELSKQEAAKADEAADNGNDCKVETNKTETEA